MQLVNRLRNLFFDEIWNLEPEQLTRFRRVIYRQLQFIYVVANRFNESEVKLQALALSFKMVLSIVPLLAVMFSLLKAFGVQNRVRPMLSQAFAPLGAQGDEITVRLLEFVNNMNVGALGAVGLVTLFWTVVSLVGNVELAFNQIWGCREGRTLTRKFSDYLSALLVGPVLLFAAIALTASLQSHELVKKLLAVEPFGSIILVVLRLLPYVTVWAAFTFLYAFLPNTRVKITSAMTGALVAAVLWQTAGWAFTAFVASSTKYYAVYSSFAILLLFLLWIYFQWNILLFGAEVAFVHQNFGLYQRDSGASVVSGAAREKLALRVMRAIGESFYFQKPAPTTRQLAQELRAPGRLLDEIVGILKEKKLVAEAEENRLLPARDLEQIQIKEIVDGVRNYGDRESRSTAEPGDPVARMLNEIDQSMQAVLKGKNLKSLILAAGETTGPSQERRYDGEK
jgi:membrane protein